MRRSFASWLIGEGEDPAYVMEQIGHNDPTMTLGIYTRAIRNRRRSVRSQRRVAALAAGVTEALDRAPSGTRALDAASTAADEAAA